MWFPFNTFFQTGRVAATAAQAQRVVSLASVQSEIMVERNSGYGG